MALLCGGLKEITERQDSLYRLIDTALFGRTYAVVSTDPELIVSPLIEPTHALTIEDEDSIFGRMEDQRQLLQNALNGTITTNYDRVDGVRDLLEAIKLAVEASDDLDDDILTKLVEIGALLA